MDRALNTFSAAVPGSHSSLLVRPPCMGTHSPSASNLKGRPGIRWHGSHRRLPQRGELGARRHAAVHGQRQVCRASADSEAAGEAARSTDDRIKATLAGLDALLGIEEEVKPKPADEEAKSAAEPVNISVSTDVLKVIADAEAARSQKKEGEQKVDSDESNAITSQMEKILQTAKRLAESAEAKDGKVQLKGDFEDLLQLLQPDAAAVAKEDLERIKKEVFGPQTFFVTEAMTHLDPGGLVGVMIRGNFRADRSKVFQAVDEGVRRLFGDKYVVQMIEDPMADEEDPRGGPRCAFLLLTAAQAQPDQTSGWQVVFAALLLLLTAGSCVQLGLLANVSRLPKETLEWLANAGSADPNILPPGLENWDPVPFLASAAPISLSVFSIQFLHDLGHRAAAFIRKVKLGPSFFIPNGQIGSFGGVLPLRSMVRDRRDLFDVAAAGPLAGGLASLALFVAGLANSAGGQLPADVGVAVPTQLFQGSLLLGSVTRAVLGEGALHSATAQIHPFLIAGWCGIVGTALNCLPVGCIDGGRMMQAAFGKSALAVTSFFTYIGLALGFLGSSLSLPFGLFVLIVQRDGEKYIQDQVTAPSEARQTLVALLVLAAVLVLLPMAPEASETVATPPPNVFL